MVSDAVAANQALVEFVLAHELDHALEDQRFGLGRGARLALDDDGGARRAGADRGLGDRGDDGLRGPLPEPARPARRRRDDRRRRPATVPDVLVEQLTWTYLGGQRFITELRELAGSWKLVDFALSERPPASTEQVLHPRKYVARRASRAGANRPGGARRHEGWRPRRPQRVRRVRDRLPAARVGRRRRRGERGRGRLGRRPLRALAAGRRAGRAASTHAGRSWCWSARWRWDSAADRAQFDRAATEPTSPTASAASRRATRVWTVDGGWWRCRRRRRGTPRWPSPRTRSTARAAAAVAAQAGRKLRRSRDEPIPQAARRLLDLRRDDALPPRRASTRRRCPEYVPISPEDAVSWSGVAEIAGGALVLPAADPPARALVAARRAGRGVPGERPHGGRPRATSRPAASRSTASRAGCSGRGCRSSRCSCSGPGARPSSALTGSRSPAWSRRPPRSSSTPPASPNTAAGVVDQRHRLVDRQPRGQRPQAVGDQRAERVGGLGVVDRPQRRRRGPPPRAARRRFPARPRTRPATPRSAAPRRASRG